MELPAQARSHVTAEQIQTQNSVNWRKQKRGFTQRLKLCLSVLSECIDGFV